MVIESAVELFFRMYRFCAIQPPACVVCRPLRMLLGAAARRLILPRVAGGAGSLSGRTQPA